MPTPSTIHAPIWQRLRDSFRRRGPGTVLALLVEALIVLLFLTFVPRQPAKDRPKPTIFGFDTDSGDAVEPTREKKAQSRSSGNSGARSPAPRPVAPVPEPTPVPPVELPSSVIWMTRPDYAATDIGKFRPQGTDTAAAAPGRGRSDYGDSELAEGRGPHGEPLYRAEWYVRPTHAQLATYLPARARTNGWGLIACRTVDNYRVEDCQEIADAPRGSGYAGAVRQAAWQFRVRPPRIGGRPMVGAWVSIRIDYGFVAERERSRPLPDGPAGDGEPRESD